MRSVTYVSSARSLWTELELEELLASARAWNAEHDLTGMMLYSDGNFIQCVEGEDADVAEALDRIFADPRHHGELIILDEQIEERAFTGWSMGFRRTSTSELGLEGHTDFLQDPAGAAERGKEGSAADILLRSFLPKRVVDLSPRSGRSPSA